MTQYWFNNIYFNLKSGGDTSTTQTWEGLQKASKNDIICILDCSINTKNKIATNMKTGNQYQLQ